VVQQEVRRVVTVVTSDLKGSTSLGEKLDPESLREVLTRYFDEMRAVLERHGGVIEKIIGDAIIAVFDSPGSPKDDPLRAVTAAAATQRALAELNEQLDQIWGVRLTTRTGVATGEVVVGEATHGQHVLAGPALQLATAMEQNAPAMEVLVHASTFSLVQDQVVGEAADPFVPKGMDQPVTAFRLVSIRPARGRRRVTTAGRRPCSNCGEVNAADARACITCGAALSSATVVQESRKTVSIVFADPKPTTASGAPPTPEALRDVMSRYFETMRTVLERHGGTVEKFIGDAVMAVFGLPVRHEDDALRAARAALDMQAALPPLNDAFAAAFGITLANHIGVNTGEVVAGDANLGQRLVTGDAVNVAARLEQAAHARDVLIGDLTYRLVRDAVDVEPVEPLILKGKAEPVPAYRLLGVRSGEGSARRQDAPMVGREDELALLTGALREAIEERVARVVTVIGDAGVGKTRLTREFLGAASERAVVLKGRCLPYGNGITFWPIIEVVREAVGMREEDPTETAIERLLTAVGGDRDVADRIASLVGLGSTAYQVGELFWGVRRFFEHLALERPVVVLFDDIHWAEPTFLDLIDHLLQERGSALLMLCTARHELLETKADWGEAPGTSRIVLQPLSEADSARVIDALLGDTGLAESARRRIVAASEGNPLFVEQLLSMLIDSGRLLRRDDRWVATSDLADLAIPPTIHALLAARLDALPADERAVVEPAAVIGLSFAQPAVEALVAEGIRVDVERHLGELTSKQLVRPQPDAAADDATYRFHHLLVRDAAYQGLLKRSRVVLHERFVAWADVVNAQRGRGLEFEEILGYHLEQAYRYRTELGPLDARGIEVGVAAAERLGSAGNRALDRGDMPAAANLLGRAATLLPIEDERRPWLLIRSGEARLELGEFEEAARRYDEVIDLAAARSEVALESTARIERLRLRYTTGAAGSDEDVAARVNELIPILEEAHDDAGLARAWRLLLYVYGSATRYGDAERAATRMLTHARASGDRLMEIRGLPSLARIALYGPLPVPDAIRRCEELLARAQGDRRAEGLIGLAIAHLRAMQGDLAQAREVYGRVRTTLVELGWNFNAALASIDSGPIELLAGDPVAAERELRGDYETLAAMGERNYISTTAAYLAEALYQQGRWEEASSFSTFSKDTVADDDLAGQYMWRQMRAKLLAREGNVAAAIELAREAVSLTEGSDDPTDQANALSDLAEVYELAGEPRQAVEVLENVVARHIAKGNIPATAATEAWMRRLTSSAAVSPAGEPQPAASPL
jgi:class 3 adenylate cyclase/tetratricopeptide (TPR) repeat protein